MRISSSLWASSASLAASTPIRRKIQLATWFKNHTAGYISLSNINRGQATKSTICSVFWMDRDLGTSSPKTMCKAVITLKPSTKAMVCSKCSGNCISSNTGCRILATVGSPIQPKPKDAIVIPNWVTERKASKCSVTFLAYTALRLPSLSKASSLEGRTLTIENSEATKKPFRATKNKTIMTLNSIIR